MSTFESVSPVNGAPCAGRAELGTFVSLPLLRGHPYVLPGLRSPWYTFTAKNLYVNFKG